MTELSSSSSQPPLLQYVSPRCEATRRGKGFIAVCGTILCPGFGHFIVARPRRAICWVLILVGIFGVTLLAAMFPMVFPALILLVPLNIVALAICLIDAYLCGRNLVGNLLNGPILRYFVGLFLVFIMLFIRPGNYVSGVVREHVADSFEQQDVSMLPTIAQRELLLCHKQAGFSRNSVVLLREPDYDLRVVSRVVGLPGETVEIVGGVLNINGKPVTSPPGVIYVSYSRNYLPCVGGQGHPITLADGEYYCLRDNPIATDSRFWTALPGHQPGAITKDRIVGTISCVYWPLKKFRKL